MIRIEQQSLQCALNAKVMLAEVPRFFSEGELGQETPAVWVIEDVMRLGRLAVPSAARGDRSAAGVRTLQVRNGPVTAVAPMEQINIPVPTNPSKTQAKKIVATYK